MPYQRQGAHTLCLLCDSQDLDNVTILFAKVVKARIFEFGIKMKQKKYLLLFFREGLINKIQIVTENPCYNTSMLLMNYRCMLLVNHPADKVHAM